MLCCGSKIKTLVRCGERRRFYLGSRVASGKQGASARAEDFSSSIAAPIISTNQSSNNKSIRYSSVCVFSFLPFPLPIYLLIIQCLQVLPALFPNVAPPFIMPSVQNCSLANCRLTRVSEQKEVVFPCNTLLWKNPINIKSSFAWRHPMEKQMKLCFSFVTDVSSVCKISKHCPGSRLAVLSEIACSHCQPKCKQHSNSSSSKPAICASSSPLKQAVLCPKPAMSEPAAQFTHDVEE